MGIRMSLSRRQNGNVLPEDLILSEILLKLPAKSLMRFKCVSKKWLDIIANDARLREAHTRHHNKARDEISSIVLAKHADDKENKHKLLFLSGDSSDDRVAFSPEVKELEMSYLLGSRVQLCSDIDVIGSSNGLVLLSAKSFFVHPGSLILWNPATRAFWYLPRADTLRFGVDFDEISHFPNLDLGFNDKNDDIKVLRVAETSLRNDDVVVTILNSQVYSKKANSWRKVDPLSRFRIQSWKPGVSIHGEFYFLVSQVTWNASHKIMVLSFRYSDDKLRNPIDVPDCYNLEEKGLHHNEFELARWNNDTLGLIAPNRTARNGYDFWVMVKKSDNIYGYRFYWSKLFAFDYCYPICGVWMDRFFIIQKHHRRSIELLLWDPKSDGKKHLKLAKLNCLSYFCVAINYVPSLVSVYPDR